MVSQHSCESLGSVSAYKDDSRNDPVVLFFEEVDQEKLCQRYHSNEQPESGPTCKAIRENNMAYLPSLALELHIEVVAHGPLHTGVQLAIFVLGLR